MKNKMVGMAALLLIAVFVLSGCSSSLQGLGTTFNLDLENRVLNCKLDAGLLGIESDENGAYGSGDIGLDVQLDLKNQTVQCKVNTDSTHSGSGDLVFFLNWKTKDLFCLLDTEYPSTEEEKAKGAADNQKFHFDAILDLQKRIFNTNLNVGSFDLHVPLSENETKEGGNVK